MNCRQLVELALEEDLAGNGDVTSEACVPAGLDAEATILAKGALIVCGHLEAAEVFSQLGVHYIQAVPEGTRVDAGTEVAKVLGKARALLAGERTALNFLMRLSGIATHTGAVVAAAPGLRIVDTRKTTPLHRASEKRAVRMGGAHNHRFGLADGVLIKDNHIVAAGGVVAAIRAARAHAHHLLRVEIEVDRLDQLDEALAEGAEVILLDNMDDATIAEAVRRNAGRALLEVSGNLDAERLGRMVGIGVDLASMGGLIHQARWADLSLELRLT